MKARNGKTLYAIAVEIIRGKTVRPVVEYVHAASQGDAKCAYMQAHPNRRTHRVVAVGPALGVFADERDEAGIGPLTSD